MKGKRSEKKKNRDEEAHQRLWNCGGKSTRRSREMDMDMDMDMYTQRERGGEREESEMREGECQGSGVRYWRHGQMTAVVLVPYREREGCLGI